MDLRKTKFGIASLLIVAALTGCRPELPSSSQPSNNTSASQPDGTSTTPGVTTTIQFWTGFGGSVNSVLQPLINRFEEINPEIKVEYESKGGYDNLRQSIVQSISNNAFPHIANGYPDHFADYGASNVLINLNSTRYIRNEDPNIGVEVNEYLPNYMVENTTLIDGATTGLPFNKSTEIMVANQTLFDIAAQVENDPTIKVPTTWQELQIVGQKLRTVIAEEEWAGKYVLQDGTAVASLTEPQKALVAIDFTGLEKADDFIPFSWDSTANFFITILRQWGAEYTRRGATLNNGTIEFHRGESRAKTLAALTFFKQLYVDKLVGIPSSFGEGLYSSTPFKKGQVALTISSSAGVKENLPSSLTDYPFEISVNAIPYNSALPSNRSVISQGTNLTLFTKGNSQQAQVQNERLAAWKLLRYLTYEVNHEFSRDTSYFPVTDGTLLPVDETNKRYQDYKLYTDFLARTDGTPEEIATRSTAVLQANVYQEKTAEGDPVWIQFVDPGFVGSSFIRLEVDKIIGNLFKSSGTPEKAINEAVGNLGSYV